MKKVLIIDDDESIRDIYSTNFKSAKYKVFCAKNGKEGLDAVEEKKPDIVLLDILMPEMDGFDFLKALKKKNPLIPAVVLTNMSSPKDKEEAILLGAKEYLLKTKHTPEGIEKIVKKILKNLKTE